MKIRLAKLSEATDIADLYIESFKRALPTVRLAHSDNEIKDWYRLKLLPKNGTWVAELNNEIAGFMSLDGDLLEELYLNIKYQNQGIGTKLLNKAKELNTEGLRTYTFQVNKNARQFYEKNGFSAVSFNSGERNEENEPDVLYEWKGI